MSRIISYDFDMVQRFMEAEESAYDAQLTQMLTFEDWKCRGFPNMFENPKKFNVEPYKWGTPIRISPTGQEMLKIIEEHNKEIQDIEFNCPKAEQDYRKTQLFKELFKPVNEFVINEPIYIAGKTSDGVDLKVPIWFNTTLDSINVRAGFANLDSSKPASLPLSDLVVHAMVGGRTGAGKSVLLNDIIVSMLLEYPPWELDLMLADFKVVELSRYGNRFPTPHVSVIAATGSTEFALSVFQQMVDEMNARSAVFTAAGVTNVKGFRKKFGLCMPRTVLIADEFVQMYENIKIAEAAGNDKADEMKKSINQAISAVARLGRSMGMHMLLSSQNMDGQLDDQTSGQFAGGITLGATPSVSTSLIGNPAGSTLEGKGKCYMNLNKAGKNPEQNVLCWVPFIQDSVSDKEAAEGKLSYLQDVLNLCCNLASKYGWDRKPFVYNEREPVAYQEFENQLTFCKHYFEHPDEGSDIKNQIYKEITAACLPLGREVVYKPNPICVLNLKRRPRSNLIVSATDEVTKLYLLKMLAQGFSQYDFNHFVIGVDIATTRQLQFDKLLNGCTISNRAVIPSKYISMVRTRQSILKFQDYLVDERVPKCWDNKLAFLYNLNNTPEKQTRDVNLDRIKSFAEMVEFDLIGLKTVDGIQEALARTGVKLEKTEVDFVASMIISLSKLRNTILQITKDENKVITAAMFKQVVIWWIGADQIEGVSSYESKPLLKNFMEQCCQVGIFNVVEADKWANLSTLSENCNYVLEKCNKEFFTDINLPRNININLNSFQLHSREDKTHAIIRTFSI